MVWTVVSVAPEVEASPLAGPLQLSVGGLLHPVVAYTAAQDATPLLHQVALSTPGASVNARPCRSNTPSSYTDHRHWNLQLIEA